MLSVEVYAGLRDRTWFTESGEPRLENLFLGEILPFLSLAASLLAPYTTILISVIVVVHVHNCYSCMFSMYLWGLCCSRPNRFCFFFRLCRLMCVLYLKVPKASFSPPFYIIHIRRVFSSPMDLLHCQVTHWCSSQKINVEHLPALGCRVSGAITRGRCNPVGFGESVRKKHFVKPWLVIFAHRIIKEENAVFCLGPVLNRLTYQ